MSFKFKSNENCPKKKYLSSSSLLPKVDYKKTKSFTSPNRFSVLAKCDDVDMNTSIIINDDTEKLSPVYIKNVSNIFTFISNLASIFDPTDLICKATPSDLFYYCAHIKFFFNSKTVVENHFHLKAYHSVMYVSLTGTSRNTVIMILDMFEDYFSDLCAKSCDSLVRCTLCDGSHPANYKGCIDYKMFKSFNRPNSDTSTNSFYTCTTSGKNHSQCCSNIEALLLTSFISEFINIIKSFFSILTSSLNKT
ncbi:hypothetical protein AGLY_003587 [Aphis glycines]|uniref:Uncharacterized protein n=1 Tax=Aphis glycines TaxID=307491 RepID=A0A6G0TYM3_APHGL|nr:hypothetical protein AGLY_003587 [Aphis glycines]